MENRPYLACTGRPGIAEHSLMKSPVALVESFTSTDLPIAEPPAPAPSPTPSTPSRPVRSTKGVKHLNMMKALASGPRLTAIELCLDGSAFTASALETPMRMSARRVSDHLQILCKVGVLSRRVGHDKREMEYLINPQLVRKAEDGTAIFDFVSEQLHFPRVRLGE